MSIDPDFLTSGVTGAPDTWGDECCELDITAIEFAQSDFTALATAFVRVEIILDAEALTDNNEQALFFTYYAAGATKAIGAFLRQLAGGNRVWRFRVYESSTTTPTIYTTATALALDTPYRIEFKWDATGDAWEIRQDNTTLFSGALTGTPAGGQLDTVLIGNPWDVGLGVTYYLDNIAVADDDWIGAEEEAGSAYDVAGLVAAKRVAIVSM